MAGLLDYAKLMDLMYANADGGNRGGGGLLGIKDIPVTDTSGIGASVNGYYAPGEGLQYGGFNAEYKKRFGDKLQQELMLKYGQDQQQNPNYGIQYKYNW